MRTGSRLEAVSGTGSAECVPALCQAQTDRRAEADRHAGWGRMQANAVQDWPCAMLECCLGA